MAITNPVAGYSGFVTRAQFPSTDLGDSEQTPSDLATVADYTHLTALRAPRPTLLTNNAHDTCCFQAGHALGPLLRAARPIFELYGQAGNLRHHVNQDPGHNYARDNREAFYRMLRDFFFSGSSEFSVKEIQAETELEDRSRARGSAPGGESRLPQHRAGVGAGGPPGTGPDADGSASGDEDSGLRRSSRMKWRCSRPVKIKATRWRLRMDNEWTVPAVEIEAGAASGTVVHVADGGRASAAGTVGTQLSQGLRVLALDPFDFGESVLRRRTGCGASWSPRSGNGPWESRLDRSRLRRGGRETVTAELSRSTL